MTLVLALWPYGIYAKYAKTAKTAKYAKYAKYSKYAIFNIYNTWSKCPDKGQGVYQNHGERLANWSKIEFIYRLKFDDNFKIFFVMSI